jgi:hypothetical protein
LLRNEEFEVLDYVDIYKVVRETNLQADIQADPSIVQDFLKRGLVKRVKDVNLQIEPPGEKTIQEHRRLVLEQGGRKDEILAYCNEFEDVNRRFKALVVRWQMRDVNGMQVVNNHTDKEYDSTIVAELGKIHEETKNVINKIAQAFPTHKRYIGRFESALNRLKDGDAKYMAIARDSYHGIWYELHESLLKLSGKERVE